MPVCQCIYSDKKDIFLGGQGEINSLQKTGVGFAWVIGNARHWEWRLLSGQ